MMYQDINYRSYLFTVVSASVLSTTIEHIYTAETLYTIKSFK